VTGTQEAVAPFDFAVGTNACVIFVSFPLGHVTVSGVADEVEVGVGWGYHQKSQACVLLFRLLAVHGYWQVLIIPDLSDHDVGFGLDASCLLASSFCFKQLINSRAATCL
jgi:hypothetical protein